MVKSIIKRPCCEAKNSKGRKIIWQECPEKNKIIFYLDDDLDFYDVSNEPRIVLGDGYYVKQFKKFDYVDINLDIVLDYSYEYAITAREALIRPASSSVSRRSSTRNEMLRASSVDPTALAITREGMNRVDRNQQNEFEYKMEDNSGSKHHGDFSSDPDHFGFRCLGCRDVNTNIHKGYNDNKCRIAGCSQKSYYECMDLCLSHSKPCQGTYMGKKCNFALGSDEGDFCERCKNQTETYQQRKDRLETKSTQEFEKFRQAYEKAQNY
ncbi:2690_t:CDS:2 [Scutellospora calospora]|uniref:2690_t:CDS:1 n=1 Tax=Scutellospora calospora TaxID=85575 RepID=A0ACA9KGL0_9GLOM|nr:2690_t:CDS:2 [Scutellospora calospora]